MTFERLKCVQISNEPAKLNFLAGVKFNAFAFLEATFDLNIKLSAPSIKVDMITYGGRSIGSDSFEVSDFDQDPTDEVFRVNDSRLTRVVDMSDLHLLPIRANHNLEPLRHHDERWSCGAADVV
jgi:hypothetical protein